MLPTDLARIYFESLRYLFPFQGLSTSAEMMYTRIVKNTMVNNETCNSLGTWLYSALESAAAGPLSQDTRDGPITAQEFDEAVSVCESFLVDTNLSTLSSVQGCETMIYPRILLKRESLQTSGSFKWSGVLWVVLVHLRALVVDMLRRERVYTHPVYLLTQSTGNHGIATIHAITRARAALAQALRQTQHFKGWPATRLLAAARYIETHVHPGVFTTVAIHPHKLRQLEDALGHCNDLAAHVAGTPRGFISAGAMDYADAVRKRALFASTHPGCRYVEHGGRATLTGYGSVGLSIHRQLPRNVPIVFLAAVGAGGPIGIGMCLKELRGAQNVGVVVVQTAGYDGFCRALRGETTQPHTTTCRDHGISDGIAVDQPEPYALRVAASYGMVDGVMTVPVGVAEATQDRTALGSSTSIALSAGLDSARIVGLASGSADIASLQRRPDTAFIVLDCEARHVRA